MSKLLDAFWRAAMYCLHPRVIALSILPLVIMAAISLGVGYFFWDDAMVWVRANLESVELVNSLIVWLEGLGLNRLRSVLAPVVVLVFALPVIVIASLLFVAWLMTPAMVALVAERRFSKLERKKGGSLLTSVAYLAGSRCVDRFFPAVVYTAVDFGAAAAHLGLVDLPRDVLRCPRRSRQHRRA